MTIRTGDWVRLSTSKGIWRIEQEVPERFEPRYSLDAPRVMAESRRFLLKRLVNEKWKAAFASESADEPEVKPLTKADKSKLERTLNDGDMIARFDAYAQRVDQILNLRFALAKKSDFVPFRKHFERTLADSLDDGMTGDAVLEAIAQSAYADCYDKAPGSATLQLVCLDHEVRRRHFVYRRLNVHDF